MKLIRNKLMKPICDLKLSLGGWEHLLELTTFLSAPKGTRDLCRLLANTLFKAKKTGEDTPIGVQPLPPHHKGLQSPKTAMGCIKV